jgi:hypothetical protein
VLSAFPALPGVWYTIGKEQAQFGQLEAARAATAANRVNQVTPYGSLDYRESGVDSQGNPTWTATTSLSPTGERLLNAQNDTSIGLSNLLGTQTMNVSNAINEGFNPNLNPLVTSVDVPKYQMVNGQPQLQTDVGGTGMEGWDKASGLIMSRLAPTIARQNEMSDAQLANQGIQVGSQAYTNAKRILQMGQNDLLNQAQVAGQGVQQNLFGQNLASGQFGNQAKNQMFGNQVTGVTTNNAALGQGFSNQFSNAQLNNAANQQAYNQALTNYQLPLNMLNALRTGAQVTNPTFSNVPQQATTTGADIMGATNAASNYGLANFNAANAAQGGMNSGLFGLGAAGIMALSDIRLKENVKPIGAINGINLYEFEYKPEFANHPFAGHGKQVGVIAQELQSVRPDAVSVHSSGYLMVNYGVLNG